MSVVGKGATVVADSADIGHTRVRDLQAIGIIAAVWIAMVIITDPIGEFPLNDDWCYAVSVRSLVQEGAFRLVSIVTMTLVTQVFWGALFCLPFGFSHNALRFSGLAAGFLGLIGTYLLLKELGASQRIALIGALLVAVNPIYFGLSNTFMTDVPFYTLAVFAIYAAVRALNRLSSTYYAASIVLAVLAILLRQSGLALPIAFGAAYLVKDGLRLRAVVKAGLPLVLGAGALIAYQSWLNSRGNLSETFGLQVGMAPKFLDYGPGPMALAVYTVSLTGLVYLGLFLFPLLVPAFLSRWKSHPSVPRAIGLAVLTFTIYMLGRTFGWMGGMPLSLHIGDIMTPFGMGPMTLSDVVVMKLFSFTPLPQAFWSSVTLVSVTGAGLLVLEVGSAAVVCLRRCRGSCNPARPLQAMMLTGALASLVPITVLFYFAYFDRYFLALIPFLVGSVVLAGRPLITRTRMVVIVIVLLLGAVFSVCATHDYLAWNRMRWAALNHLTIDKRIPASKIDGGYEFNGLYNYESRMEQGMWHEIVEDYAVTFAPIDGYEIVEQRFSRRWMPYGPQCIYVLKAWEYSPESQTTH